MPINTYLFKSLSSSLISLVLSWINELNKIFAVFTLCLHEESQLDLCGNCAPALSVPVDLSQGRVLPCLTPNPLGFKISDLPRLGSYAPLPAQCLAHSTHPNICWFVWFTSPYPCLLWWLGSTSQILGLAFSLPHRMTSRDPERSGKLDPIWVLLPVSRQIATAWAVWPL